jgi:hypothetical protein
MIPNRTHFAGALLIVLFILSGCVTTNVVQRVVDGKQRNFSYRKGVPLASENDWVKINSIRPHVNAVAGTNDVELVWIMTLTLKIKNIKEIKLHDATTTENELVISEINPKTSQNSYCKLRSKEIHLSEQLTPWFFSPDDTEKIFKIIIVDSNDQQEILYQPLIIHGLTKKAVLTLINEEGEK